MIIIKTKNSKHLFRYIGNIKLYTDDEFLWVNADRYQEEEDELILSTSVYDTFWLNEIESIMGE